jgi:phospholipid/cholesterol/gamma-HCH transport system substrate-binding protein
MKFFTKEVKIALTAIVGIVVLFYGLQFLKGLNVFSTDITYYVAFDDVSGLSPSSPVYANGYRVGVVKSLN